MKFSVKLCLILISVFSSCSASRVYELSDKFLDISHEGMWFVKFYAPWCAHCRRLEPVWAHVAQSMYNSAVKVAKVDCTRFSTVATHFKIQAFPTILFIKGSFHHEYHGDREKDEMVNYAMRMSQPAVQQVLQTDTLDIIKEAHLVFFGFVGKTQGPLWETFVMNAQKYQPHSWFYSMPYAMMKNDIKPPNETAVFVYKDRDAFFFKVKEEHLADKDNLNLSLDKWINSERFGFFPKITRSNLDDLMETEKYIVIAVVSENKLNEITQTERDFKDMIEDLIRKRKREFHGHFQFGWIGTPDLANSIAMSELTLPHLLVLNSTTNHHHIPDDDPMLMTPEAIVLFLDQIQNQVAPTYGGNHWPVRLYRGFYEARSTLSNMWRGNPVLTTLVFGLPLGFLSLICYSICCADLLDADDDETEETHEKTD